MRVELYDRLPADFVVVILRYPVVSRLTVLPLLPEDLRLPCEVTVLFFFVVLLFLSVLTRPLLLDVLPDLSMTLPSFLTVMFEFTIEPLRVAVLAVLRSDLTVVPTFGLVPPRLSIPVDTEVCCLLSEYLPDEVVPDIPAAGRPIGREPGRP